MRVATSAEQRRRYRRAAHRTRSLRSPWRHTCEGSCRAYSAGRRTIVPSRRRARRLRIEFRQKAAGSMPRDAHFGYICRRQIRAVATAHLFFSPQRRDDEFESRSGASWLCARSARPRSTPRPPCRHSETHVDGPLARFSSFTGINHSTAIKRSEVSICLQGRFARKPLGNPFRCGRPRR